MNILNRAQPIYMRKSPTAINNDIIKDHNAGMFRNWEARKSEMNANWQEFPDEGHAPYVSQATPWRMNPLIAENRQEFDLEEALNDPLNDTQLTFNFENRDPNEDKFSDDVLPSQR